MNPLKKLAGQTAIYGLSSIVARSINFLLVPLYTAYLSAESYGTLSIFYGYVAFFNVIYLFGMETAYFRYASKEDDQHAFNTAVSYILIISLTTSLALFLFADTISNYIGNGSQPIFVQMMAVVLAIDAFVAIPLARLRRQNRAKKFAAVRMANIGINILLNLFFIKVCMDVRNGEYLTNLLPSVLEYHDIGFLVGYILLANLISNGLMIPMLMSSFKGFRFQLPKEFAKPMLTYGYPLVFVGLSGIINEVLDRIVLSKMLPENFYGGLSTTAAVGIYSACYKFSMFIALVIQAFRYAAEPFFFSQAKDKNAPTTYAEVMKWFIIALAIIFVVIGTLREPIGWIILRQPEYRQGLIIVPILLLANMFLGIYYNLTVWYKMTDKTSYGTLISIIGASITIALNFILIPLIGYLGSAIATLICYFTMTVISYLLGQKFFPVPYHIDSALKYLIVSAAFVGVTYFDFGLTNVAAVCLSALLILAFLGFVYLSEKRKIPFKN